MNTPPTVADELRPAYMGATTQTVPGTAADLVFTLLSIAAQPAPGDGEEDPRPEEIAGIVSSATPAVRTRAAQLTSHIIPILARLRSVILSTKSELQDEDVAHGDAEITPDGWLVVTMAGEQIGRLPFDPERGQQEAARLAEEMLSEHVRLHVMRAADVVRVPLPDDAGEMPPRPDGVRARRLIVQ